MTDRLSYAELSEIFEGAANSRRQFIADHRRRKDRPDTWFHQQERELRARAREVLDFVSMSHVETEYAGNLSGGQKKLLELARTLMTEPRLVLLDEPAAGVNPTLMGRIRERIIQLNRERGITFLLIEHDMPLVMGLCNPVIVMNAGRKLAEGEPEAVRSDPLVLEAYLGGQHGSA